MEEKNKGFIRNGIFSFICAVLCAITATAFTYFMIMLLLARVGGYHGMTQGEIIDKARDRISEHSMARMINFFPSVAGIENTDYYDEGYTPETDLPKIEEAWKKTIEDYGDTKNVDYAVIISEESDLNKIDLNDEKSYFYKSPAYTAYEYYLSVRMHNSYYNNYYRMYEVVMNDCYPYINRYEDTANKSGYFVYVLYKTADQLTDNKDNHFDTMYLDENLITFLGNLYRADSDGVGFEVFLFALALTFFILYCCSAGYRKNREGICLSFVDRIPLEIVYAVVFFTELFLTFFLYNMLKFFSRDVDDYFSFGEAVMLCCSLLFVIMIIGIGFLGTNIVRIKAKTFWKNTILFRIKDVVFGWISKSGTWVAKHIPVGVLILIALPVIFVISVVEAAFIQDGSNFLAFLFVIGRFGGVALALYLIWGYCRLREGARRIAAGNLDEPVDEKRLFADYRLFAQDLNGMSESIQLAVEERMKSERMKTQLITNVSHDIKTPLTSIINYIDLLKKEDATEADKEEYLGILSKQSDRLKKLIQDLIDASKASSGAVDVNLSDIDLGTLAGQVMGEYQDKFEQAGLTMVSKIPEESVMVKADSNLLWRVMDNLYGNVLKYAMSGTRVYTELSETEAGAVLSISNISKEELGISGEELMERFVRGDKSRNTEGSGLGLSIAGSLMELMGGELKIHVDGDMFKAVLKMPR